MAATTPSSQRRRCARIRAHYACLLFVFQMVDSSSRIHRPGKVSPAAAVPDILTRLQIDTTGWKATLVKLIGTMERLRSALGVRFAWTKSPRNVARSISRTSWGEKVRCLFPKRAAPAVRPTTSHPWRLSGPETGGIALLTLPFATISPNRSFNEDGLNSCPSGESTREQDTGG